MAGVDPGAAGDGAGSPCPGGTGDSAPNRQATRFQQHCESGEEGHGTAGAAQCTHPSRSDGEGTGVYEDQEVEGG